MFNDDLLHTFLIVILQHCLIKNIWLRSCVHKSIFTKQLIVCSKSGTFCNTAAAHYGIFLYIFLRATVCGPLPNYFLYDF
jgi:hypothetical protein